MRQVLIRSLASAQEGDILGRMGRIHLNEVLGAKIKSLRQEAGITQAVLSQRTGLFRTHLSRIECGIANPTLGAIVLIANALEVTPGMLLRESAPVVAGDTQSA